MAEFGNQIRQTFLRPQKLAGLRPAQNFHVIALVQALPGKQLVKDDTDRKNIRSVINVLPLGLLGGHVGHFSFEHPGFGGTVPIGNLGNAEIENLDLTGVRHENILRTDVAMHNMQRVASHIGETVGIFQSGTYRSRNGKTVFKPERTLLRVQRRRQGA